MLPDLLAWFTGKEVNKRKYPRKRKPYTAAYTVDGKTLKPAIGIDISGGGLCLITQSAVGRDQFEIVAKLDERQVRCRVKVVWQDQVQHKGAAVFRYGMRFTGIRADDWDAIMRYTADKPVGDLVNKAQEELTSVRMTPDETARLIPVHLQRRLLQMLVDRRRLAPLTDKTPLVQYFYSGLVRQNDRLMHRLTIQSKVVGAENDEMYETRFVFDENGANVSVLN